MLVIQNPRFSLFPGIVYSDDGGWFTPQGMQITKVTLNNGDNNESGEFKPRAKEDSWLALGIGSLS